MAISGLPPEVLHLREDKGQLKIKQKKESRRVYWMPILARGKLHVELLGSEFPGDKVEGMEEFVEKLAKAVRMRFPDRDDQPNIVYVDRGEGFYASNGKITQEFATALRKHGLKAFHGKDAEAQPGRSGDLWLHETTVSWMRERMKRTQPVEPWAESEEQLGKRLKAAAGHCTSRHDVEGLCKEFPARMHDLVHVTKGDRLGKWGAAPENLHSRATGVGRKGPLSCLLALVGLFLANNASPNK